MSSKRNTVLKSISLISSKRNAVLKMISVKLLNRKGALQDVLKVHEKIKPTTVVHHVIGFDEALEKAYGTGEKEDE